MTPPEMSIRRRLLSDRASLAFGLLCAAAVNGALLTGVWLTRSHTARRQPQQLTYVDATLVRFGKKRDLSFLPHVQATPKSAVKPKAVRVTDDPDRPRREVTPDKDEPQENLSKINERFRNLREEPDDRATVEAAQEGDEKGVRGGTAAEAAGDPFILAVKGAITERWSVPTVLTAAELARLKAVVCLKIDEDGRLAAFELRERSGNTLFDGSLDATLGSIKTLPRPVGPFAAQARRGALCAEFMKE